MEQRGTGRWVCRGEEGTLRDLGTVEFAREMGLQWVRWSEKKKHRSQIVEARFWEDGSCWYEKKRSEIVEFAREMGCNLLV